MRSESKPLIVLTGGGTGGHITPILAVAEELKHQHDCWTVYVGERGSKYTELTENHAAIDKSYSLFSGKYRRYYGESWLERLLDVQTILLNIRDAFRVLIGLCQAWWLLGKLQPNMVFLKGGFVGVPVGLAAALRGIPIVTHDSDVLPGLANRLVSRWVNIHATAMPPETYAYPKERTVQVGVLVERHYQHVTPEAQRAFKDTIGAPKDAMVLLVTGGSSGAQVINKAMEAIVERLLEHYPHLHIYHQVGKGRLADIGVQHERLHTLEFLHPMYTYMGAADIVVARASGNTLAEIGTQGKPAIVIPSPVLADGHQLRNAAYLNEKGMARVVQEDDLPEGLGAAISDLLEHPKKGKEIAQKLQQSTSVDSAKKLATLLLQQAGVR